MMKSRRQLIKTDQVLSSKCGKRIGNIAPWPFFIAIDFESSDRQAIFREDPIYIKFVEESIKPMTSEYLALDYEMDPGKDVNLT